MTSPVTSATPAVRRRMPRAERAEQLLDVAESVFTAKGIQAASMDDIAEAAGVSKPILYDHYGSKDRLIAAVVERAGVLLGELVVDAVATAPEPESAIATGLRAYFAFIDERRSGLGSLLSEGVAPGSEAAAALEEVRNLQAGLIAALLLEHSTGGDIDEANVYAQIVVGATERLALRPGAPDIGIDGLTQRVMDVIWVGFDRLRDGARWSTPATS